MELLEFTPMGTVLAVRPFCHNDHDWDVHFATNETLVEVCGESKYPVPEQHLHLRKVG